MKMGSTVKIRSKASGFTLVELLVTISIISILAALLLAAVAKAKLSAKRVRCVNNFKQTTLACFLYSSDNLDALPVNYDGVHPDWTVTNWVAGNMSQKAESSDKALLIDENRTLLARYLRTSFVFKCPADLYQQVRSLSMNARMNPVRDADPPRWLAPAAEYATFRKLSDIEQSSSIFLMIDERADTINDAYFAVDLSNTGLPYGNGDSTPFVMVDWPSSYHGGQGNISFGDGHVASKKWFEATTRVPNGQAEPVAFMPANDRDIAWLQSHATFKR